ncbi:hypothetical protein BDR26DRAFT_1013571 [Obelidium mucronatum]|nr:hypothetical protein BDR26DRAFT_1013571 [Obelidium mucronatum]
MAILPSFVALLAASTVVTARTSKRADANGYVGVAFVNQQVKLGDNCTKFGGYACGPKEQILSCSDKKVWGLATPTSGSNQFENCGSNKAFPMCALANNLISCVAHCALGSYLPFPLTGRCQLCGTGAKDTTKSTCEASGGNGHICYDLLTDSSHCGTCAATVYNFDTQKCVGGTPVCADGKSTICLSSVSKAFDNQCHDLDVEHDNCGTCGNKLLEPSTVQQCVAGKASCVDPAFTVAEDGLCHNLQTDDWFCGTVKKTDPGNKHCCSGVLYDLSSDLKNCGTCGNDVATSGGDTCCTGVPKNVQTDKENCGACGTNVLTSGNNECCSGTPVNTNTDAAHCGSCAGTCSTGSGEQCCAGLCKNLTFDPFHCGTCANKCGSGSYCHDSVCTNPSSCSGCSRCNDHGFVATVDGTDVLQATLCPVPQSNNPHRFLLLSLVPTRESCQHTFPRHSSDFESRNLVLHKISSVLTSNDCSESLRRFKKAAKTLVLKLLLVSLRLHKANERLTHHSHLDSKLRALAKHHRNHKMMGITPEPNTWTSDAVAQVLHPFQTTKCYSTET